VLSPCVLPILPIVFGAARSQHRFGPAALAAGVAISFVAVGLFVATVGFSLGLDVGIFHRVGGALLLVFGLVLLAPRLQSAVEAALAPVSGWASARTAGLESSGLWGQAGLGLLLGTIWSPCVGPTLGAASLLASQGKDLPSVALTMAVFGLGAAAPLLLVGSLSRAALQRWRSGLSGAGRWGRWLLGWGMAAVGLLAVTGFDHAVEAWLVDVSPAWLTQLAASI
jgi:cytochrome c-type biogenesis protein